jgi:Arc/MetJ-type ribon-helix-helix transcriptional regulator
MPFSVRLDPKTESAVARLARRRRQSKSDVVRDALRALERDDAATASGRPVDALAHLIGVVDSGDGTLSENTGDRFRALLIEKAHARRATRRRSR